MHHFVLNQGADDEKNDSRTNLFGLRSGGRSNLGGYTTCFVCDQLGQRLGVLLIITPKKVEIKMMHLHGVPIEE